MSEFARFIHSADLWECPECGRWNREGHDVGGDWVDCRDCDWGGVVLVDGEDE